MVKLMNNSFLKALLRQPVDRTPVWVMRQAGRYLPEYRKLKAKVCSFMTLCTTPDLACEITMQPLQRFDLEHTDFWSKILQYFFATKLLEKFGFCIVKNCSKE